MKKVRTQTKRILSVLLAVVMVVCAVPVAFAEPCSHNSLKHYAEGQSTNGEGYLCVEHWFCQECSHLFADPAATQQLSYDQVYSIPCTHKDVYYNKALAPKCGQNGGVEYWTCRKCCLNFADAAATQVLSDEEIYRIPFDYDKHEFLYNIPFEESADRCWVSLGISIFDYISNGIEPLIDRQNGTVSVEMENVEGFIVTETLSCKYCAHCGAVIESHCIEKDQHGEVVYDQQTYGGSVYLDDIMFLHQPGSVENDLTDYTEMPVRAEEISYGKEYFDLEEFLIDLTNDLFNEFDIGSEAFMEYLSTAKVYLNADKSSFKAVLSDKYILDDYRLQLLSDINYADYIKTVEANHIHSYAETVTTPATCSATGSKTLTCSCGDTYTEIIAINASNHVNTKNVAATPSTCTVKGYTAGVYCNDCKKYISGHQEQPLAAHQTTLINAKDATYDADGYTGDTYCTACRQTLSYGSVIPKLVKPDDPTNPTNPTNPTPQPTQPQQQPSGSCKYCGQNHSGFPGILIGFFHSILALFGLRK